VEGSCRPKHRNGAVRQDKRFSTCIAIIVSPSHISFVDHVVDDLECTLWRDLQLVSNLAKAVWPALKKAEYIAERWAEVVKSPVGKMIV
jgi:hypothetical protein